MAGANADPKPLAPLPRRSSPCGGAPLISIKREPVSPNGPKRTPPLALTSTADGVTADFHVRNESRFDRRQGARATNCVVCLPLLRPRRSNARERLPQRPQSDLPKRQVMHLRMLGGELHKDGGELQRRAGRWLTDAKHRHFGVAPSENSQLPDSQECPQHFNVCTFVGKWISPLLSISAAATGRQYDKKSRRIRLHNARHHEQRPMPKAQGRQSLRG